LQISQGQPTSIGNGGFVQLIAIIVIQFLVDLKEQSTYCKKYCKKIRPNSGFTKFLRVKNG
jgi:hypothetical protein